MTPRPSNLHQLRAAWRAAGGVRASVPCFRMDAAGDRATLYVQGMIGAYETDAAEFVQAVHALPADQPVDLQINSPGGFVWDGMAMYDAVLNHPGEVTTHVSGLAASAASFLALAGDTVQIAKPARMMVHMAQIIAMGSPDEVQEAVDLGNMVSADIAGIYADRAGGTTAGWIKAMKATTWYSSAEAVDAGLASAVAGASTSGTSNRSRLIKARAAVALGGVK